MDTQLDFIGTLDGSLEAARTVEAYSRGQLEAWAAILKKAGWHVYPHGRVQRLSVSRQIDSFLIERMKGAGELNSFIDHVQGYAARAIGEELFRQRLVAKDGPRRVADWQYQVNHTVHVVRPNLEMET